ncbi:MAG TPA: thiamine pyrophosphate-dependent enzyme [Caulobacteraceae bacterium]|nr:thiamine pyrophosphate-dependent enzyme [Caulobacteraceae bacterium]
MKTKQQGPDRRRFLKGSVLGAAGTLAPAPVLAAESAPAPTAPATPVARPPWLMAAEARPGEAVAPPQFVDYPGSDFMVDVLKALDIEYLALVPGSTFRGLQESVASYAGNQKPEMIVCMHEEISAGICHGYFKVAGKPMACLVHSNVGLQHASMAIYNAWCDRVPIIVLAGNVLDTTKRRPGVEWYHSAQDLGALVRDFTKWDDTPVSLAHFAESAARAHSYALTAPMEPVLLVADAELQENAVEDRTLRLPRPMAVTSPVGEPAAVAKAAELLLAAKNPVIALDRSARSAAGVALLVRLAETVNAPVVDLLGRMNFPTGHYLNQTWLQQPLITRADLVLGLEIGDPWGLVNMVSDVIGRPSRRLIREDCKVVHVSAEYLLMKSNNQDFERYFAADLAIAGEVEATLPQLIAAVEQRLTLDLRSAIAARKPALEAAFKRMRDAAKTDAAKAWDASPITTARIYQEIWDKIRNENWALVSPTNLSSRWPHRLWEINEFHQYIGGDGGAGVGYCASASVGAALAHKSAGRIVVNVQGDGDLMMSPGVFWTQAHHSIPMLTVMHNNRAWHQEAMHLQRMASRRRRHPENSVIGTTITDPFIDFAAMARSMGVWAEGPIADPAKLGPALARALAVVKSGKPALLDVIAQPR